MRCLQHKKLGKRQNKNEKVISNGKDGSCFTTCAKLHERIVSQFKDNVSQRKIAKNLGS